MAISSFWRSRNSRTPLIVLLLLISLATAGLIALQAQYSSSSQRATAESVLHDYGSLIADEVIRRSAADIGYNGFYPLMEAMSRQVQQSNTMSASTGSIFLASPDPRLKRAAGLAKGYFQMDPANGALNFFGDAPGDELTAWLVRNLQSISSRTNAPQTSFHSLAGNTPRMFVAGPARKANDKPAIVGFEVDLEALNSWFAAAVHRQPLVPASLSHGQVTNAFVHLTIRDHGGVDRFHMGERISPSLTITKDFGDTYQGIFSGFTVEAAIDPGVSGRIFIGGMPRSRLPFFLGLFALNAGLIVTAILQLRREMALQKLREEFVSSVSHELRTPLTQIRMFAETLLLDRIRSPQERRRSLEIIDREARRLAQLVENVLQFSRAERQVDSLARQSMELAPLISETVDDFESAVPEGQARFETRLSFGLTAHVDPDALRQILINLLDNAVKYGPRNQLIIVGLLQHDGMASLFVDDQGPGVPGADRRRIFEQFLRLERDRTSAIAGTGIGLSVVQDLVVRHGGRCSVISGDRGGAKFMVELPLASPECSHRQAPEAAK